MRHASPRTTLEFYVKARKKLKRTAQEAIGKLLFPGDEDSPPSWDYFKFPAHIKEKVKRDALNGIASMIFGDEEHQTPSERDEAQAEDNEDYLM
jgi:hypothetical protein